MPNAVFRDRFTNQVAYAVKEAANAAKVEHPGLVGRIRELAVSNIFAPILPSGFQIGTGKISDSKGNLSGETDLVIYNSSILPPVMYSERDGVYPIEACFYSIEIKSQATASTLQDAIRKGREILNLDHSITNTDRLRNLSSVVLTYFAFGSDLSDSGITELERYANYDPQWKESPILKAICVVGKGYWYRNYTENCWFFHPPTETHDEVIDFASGTVNTIGTARQQIREAKLGLYLMLERAVTKIEPVQSS